MLEFFLELKLDHITLFHKIFTVKIVQHILEDKMKHACDSWNSPSQSIFLLLPPLFLVSNPILFNAES